MYKTKKKFKKRRYGKRENQQQQNYVKRKPKYREKKAGL